MNGCLNRVIVKVVILLTLVFSCSNHKSKIYELVDNDNLSGFKAYINNGFSMESQIKRFQTEKYTQTILHYVCNERKKDFVLFLIDKGIDVNIENELGETPIYSVLNENSPKPISGKFYYKESREILELLIQSGASLSHVAKNSGLTPYEYAKRIKNTEAQNILKENKE